MRIYLATWMEEGQGKGLTKAECRKRLISFYFIRSQKVTDAGVREYINTGLIAPKKKKERKGIR